MIFRDILAQHATSQARSSSPTPTVFSVNITRVESFNFYAQNYAAGSTFELPQSLSSQSHLLSPPLLISHSDASPSSSPHNNQTASHCFLPVASSETPFILPPTPKAGPISFSRPQSKSSEPIIPSQIILSPSGPPPVIQFVNTKRQEAIARRTQQDVANERKDDVKSAEGRGSASNYSELKPSIHHETLSLDSSTPVSTPNLRSTASSPSHSPLVALRRAIKTKYKTQQDEEQAQQDEEQTQQDEEQQPQESGFPSLTKQDIIVEDGLCWIRWRFLFVMV